MSPFFQNTRSRFVCLAVAILALACASLAQDGVSTAGAARAKLLGNLGLLPSSREIVVEDFVNYHRHEIGRPKAGEAVGLDVRWGSESVVKNGMAVLQVGLSTGLAHDRQQLRPLNLSLVIDKSGSMADNNKLSRVKSALLTLVSQLRPFDTLSIVVFDADAQVLLPAKKVTDRESIQSLIREIEPGSSTNIHAGLMLGYKEALKNFKKESTNRVILLTDGIANEGVTDPKAIANASLSYNDHGVDLSTIGVGLDLNKDLLRDLAKSGRGLFHFVADSEDIQKVFVNELQSLISPVATEPNLVIEFGPGLAVDKVYGYGPKVSENSVKIKLDNMNSGMTEVVLVRFRARNGVTGGQQLPVKVHLTYYDLERKKTIDANQKSFVTLAEGPRQSRLDESSVAKNYTIAQLAQSIHDMAASCERKQYRDAENLLNASISDTHERYPSLDDADIKRTLSIAQKDQDVLHKENRALDVSDDRGTRVGNGRTAGSLGDNVITNGNFLAGKAGFVSDREYIKPSPNCLWGGYYTVVPAFNSPFQLHTNVVDQPFSAPGGGQVLFMNTGGKDQFTVLSTKVRFKPNTKYRIRFREIGLSGGPEWVNSYEIRVGSDRSEALVGGDGKYVEVAYEWNSGTSTSATVSIVRLPHSHGGGVVGISNLEMVPIR